ncbi:hypothetical protein GE061_006600 [Apolygus lucorum]|uniref:Uncharacterized protein n=1 Tax=Apolygus lucorum TaxID=248454 RepID=A0A6A4JCP9_APOLU|nr:hypothetical protein GE061_006600 [Apolygus lucorum]
MPAQLNRGVKEEKCHVEEETRTGPVASDPLQRLLPKIENFTTTIPDAVLVDLMASAGFSSNDPAIVRLISLAAQKWLSGVTYDALQHSKVRTSNQSSKSHHGHSHNQGDRRQDRRTLTMEDLTPALAEQGITIRKPLYYE